MRLAMGERPSMILSTQGPAALTTSRANASSSRPVSASRIPMRQTPSVARTETTSDASRRRPAVGGVAGVENDEAGVIHPAIGIFEAGRSRASAACPPARFSGRSCASPAVSRGRRDDRR